MALAGLLNLLSGTALAGAHNLLSPQARDEFIVFYANETSRDALASRNYQMLFEALRASGRPNTTTIISAITRDVERFDQLVVDQAEIIVQAALKHHFGAAIFTNALARRNVYRLVGPTGSISEPAAIGRFAPTALPVLAGSPLSQPNALREALQIVAGLPEAQGRKLVLIASSHGDERTAVMPRVLTDMSRVDRSKFLAALLTPTSEASNDAQLIGATGISKLEFWRALETIGPQWRFAMVFREACRSGVGSFMEYREIPAGVDHIAHFGSRDIKLDEIDYSKLFAAFSLDREIAQQLESRLLSQGAEVSNKREILAGLFKQEIVRFWPAALFAPLLAWIVWIVRRLFGTRWANRASIGTERG